MAVPLLSSAVSSSVHARNDALSVRSASTPLVGIVIVNYRSIPDLLICLRSLETLSYRTFRLVVVDNDSGENLDELEQAVSGLGGTLIRSTENGGFAAANNLGIRDALASEVDYLWLLNPDTVVAPDSLAQFVKRAEASDCSLLLGSKILYGELDAEEALRRAAAGPALDGTERVWGAGGSILEATRSVRMDGWGELDKGNFQVERVCDYLPGCSIFLSAEIARSERMDESFFMYFEETAWCRSLSRKGVPLIYLPESVVWHRFHDEKMQGPRTVYYYNRNELFFWFEQLGWKERVKLWFQVLFAKLPQAKKALREAPSEELRAVFRSHVQACRDFLFARRGKRAFPLAAR